MGWYLVTGASRGIGNSIANQLVKRGHQVIGLSRWHELSSNVEFHALKCDLGNVDDIKEASQKIMEMTTHLDGIVHNAGIISPIMPILETDDSQWRKLLEVNLLGVQTLTSLLCRIIGGDSHTRIVTVSSGASKRAIHSWSAYCSSKAALDMWTDCMAIEGESQNISALSIAPGIVDTMMQENIRDSSPEYFPDHYKFLQYHQNDQLADPSLVAEMLLPYCTAESGLNGDRLDVRDL